MTALDIRHLQFARRRRPAVLHDVSLALEEGEILCLLGANGAGKSTLLSCVLGIESGWQGQVRMGGRDFHSLSRREMARLVAYVPQDSRMAFSFSVEQSVMMGRTPHMAIGSSPGREDRDAVERALASVGLESLRDRAFTEISGGEQQLVLLARALAQDSPIILLDEPTASLDLGNQGRVLRIVRNLADMGRSVLMASHIPEHAFLLGGRVAMMKQGAIVASGEPGLVCTEPLLSDLYGAPVHVLTGTVQAIGTVAACIPGI